MINDLQLRGLSEQPKQRDAYLLEKSIIKNNWDSLKQTLNKQERKKLLSIIDANDMIGFKVAQDCYVNGLCTALKFMLDNIYEEI